MRSSMHFLKGVVPALCALVLAGCGSSDSGGGATITPGSGGAAATGGSGASSGDASVSASGGSAGSGGTAAGGAGTGGATSNTGGAGPKTCADLACVSPATCDATGPSPKCVCPVGFTDTKGDGSQCVDIDECALGTAECDPNATCKNTPGNFECTCNAPAYTGDGTTCTCAAGYTNLSGADASVPLGACLKKDLQTCSSDSECADGHCVAGACCKVACNTPGPCEQLTGTVCANGDTCQYGFIADNTPCDVGDKCATATCFQGVCSGAAKNCSDTSSCTTDTCDKNTGACVHTPVTCDDGNPCTTDTCDAVKGCQHTDAVGGSCNDGDPCTVSDTCSGGLCQGKPMDCSAKTNDCNTGACVNGACQAQPANGGKACTNGLDACDAKGTCNSTGTCVGDNLACGSLASSCATCTSGTGCTSGRLCTCKSGSTLVNGVCVATTDECLSTPCVAGATCTDPNTTSSGNYVCTCPKGYTGDGKKTGTGCTDINECAAATNPCGANSTCTNTTGSYTCTCAAGFKSITTASGPACICDLSGSYALVGDTTLTWPQAFLGFVEASPTAGVTTRSWSLRYQTIGSTGTMTVQTIPCGATTPDICDTYYGEAHAQYQPNEAWGKKKLNDGFPAFSVNVSGVVPNANTSYVEPQTADLMGIVLKNANGAVDPTAPWPVCGGCVGVPKGQTCTCADGTQHTVTNEATWVDGDGDTYNGVTLLAVPHGGLSIDNAYPDPPYDYVEPSVCPRLATPSGGYLYAAVPGVYGFPFQFFSTYEWHAASRIISQLKSTTVTFDATAKQCNVSGTVTGPANGQIQTDARMDSCMTCTALETTSNPGCTPADACNPNELNFYDSATQSETVKSATFALHKLSINLGTILALADGPTKESQLNQACAEVRVSYCPAGKTCK